ncbi:MAG: phytanoyl-CoA dioxygenase family protein [Erythrobacter sp.]|uniref:phytanoyl-CoA dioxygenase family protein n=1 Tax=Erythrobacter sp. TaxID=1042 RepID=UPI0025F219C0|nr:phytanoyl-CoA dioxygenase family protein [Erythrobacter sp.]MCL9998930.1 phytanoyl-CoA dioxygenase family protein [Erythrobacter sp.]
MASAFAGSAYEAGEIMGGLYGEGIIAHPGAFPAALADTLHAEIMALFAEARTVPGGALARGPERWYVETQPERLSAFPAIVSHPWFVAVCEAVLGRDYRIIEVGFDIPFPSAADQPWHRDFAVPEATTAGRRLNSLAFNMTTIDTRPEHGPFEIAPGTQWDVFDGCPKGMFPPADLWPRYAARAVKKLPRRGDISARSALTVHRGTANRSAEPRPVLVIGVDAPDATNGAHHDLQATAAYIDSLPPVVRDHLPARVVDALTPVVQNHVIDGLLTPAY